jgi:hypothetical protein
MKGKRMKGYDKETGIWTIEKAKSGHKHDASLISAIWMLYRPKSIIDIGCGDGWYCWILNQLSNHTSEILGIEGTPDIKKISYFDDIEITDLTKEPKSSKNFKFGLCLEVGEHIPTKYEETFLNHIKLRVSNKLIISWAPPGQSGTGHVNCREQEYVIDKFKELGFLFNIKETKILRIHSWFKWFKRNIMVYDKK